MRRALIVGAGIGGLAAGIALRRAGWQVTIVEQADAPRELGFGVGLAPNALAALRELGVGDVVQSRAVEWRSPTAIEIRHADGRLIRRIAGDPRRLSPNAELVRLIMRPALHGALLDAVGVDSIVANRRVTHVDVERAGVRFDDGSSATGDVVIGADGFHSVVRAHLHPDEAPPRPSGYYALRGASRNLAALGDLQGIWYFARGVECGVVQAGADRIYWFLSLFVDDERREGAVDAAALLRRWSARLDDQFRAIAAGSDIRLDELFERAPLNGWGRGAVTLLGDAAHPVLPHTGQGAAQALEDAVGLGRALRSATDPVPALRRYEEVRRRVTSAVVRSGPRIARVTTSRSGVMAAFRNTAIRLVPLSLLAGAMSKPATDPNRRLGPPLTTAGNR